MKTNIFYSKKASKFIKSLDLADSARIIKKITYFSKQENIFSYAKPVKNSGNSFRFRIGEYRAIFNINKEGEIRIILVSFIGHRRDIYKNL